jgi:potassium channel subfamily K
MNAIGIHSNKEKRNQRNPLFTIPLLTGLEGELVLKKAISTKKKPKPVSKAILRSLCIVLGFIFTGWAFFGTKYKWTLIDSFYFAMVTVTTVGYGDLTPDDNSADHTFVWLYAFTGVVLIGASLTDLVVALSALAADMAKHAKEEALEQSNALIAAAMEGTDLEAAEEEEAARSNMIVRFGRFLILEAKHLVSVCSIWMQLGAVWSLGALILMQTDDFTFVQGFYGSAITGLSIGYGDISPTSQEGRLAFTFFIPFVVVTVVGTIPQMLQVVSDVVTVKVVEYRPLSSILDMDEDGDGGISQTEYVLFNLIARRAINPEVVKQLKEQFTAMDADGSGALEINDFPTSVCIQRSITVTDDTITAVELDVVPREQAGALLRETAGVSAMAIAIAGKLKVKAKSVRSASSRGQSSEATNPMGSMASLVAMGAISKKNEATDKKILV